MMYKVPKCLLFLVTVFLDEEAKRFVRIVVFDVRFSLSRDTVGGRPYGRTGALWPRREVRKTGVFLAVVIIFRISVGPLSSSHVLLGSQEIGL